MRKIRWHRWKRRLTACTSVDLIGAGTMIAVAAGVVFHDPTTTTNIVEGSSIYFPWWFSLIAIAVLALLVFRAWLEYQKRTYDPTWVLKFDKRFNGTKMKKIRSKAAKCIDKNKGNLNRRDSELSDIDDLLDFFDDLGFYTTGHQITPEVVHHHFHHWTRGYYQVARVYIEAWREKESTRWEYVKDLYDMTNEIESERSGGREIKTLSADDVRIFLQDEIALHSNSESK